ncbi:MAG TPA: glycosyltransferase family 2 protein [Chitinophaga sp.]
MQLSIIIVNYKSAALIVDCIRSILRQTSAVAYEIIVVDNLSGDDGESLIRAAYPAVQWLQMGYNAGFARANNAGIRVAKGEFMLLLNPDTLVLDQALDKCVARFAQSAFVACGVQLLHEDGTPQISGNYFMKGGLNHLLPLPYWGGLIRALGYAVKTKVPNVLQAGTVQEVDWINGAFLMVKAAVLPQTGLLDEDFFLYAEETEWCSRLRKAGRLAIFGDLFVTHLQGASANAAFNTRDKGYYGLFDRKGLQIMLSNHLRVRKQYGVLWYLILLLNYTWDVPVFFVCSFLENLFRGRNPFRDWKPAAGLAVNVAKMWGLTPTIIRNKPHFYKVL